MPKTFEKLTLSAIPQAMAPATQYVKTGLQCKAGPANTGTVYLGGSDVTAVSGYPLIPGESVFLPVGELQLISAISSMDGDSLHILYL